MTLSNKTLAARALERAKGSDGLRRRAYLCVGVALGTTGTTGTTAAARSALEVIDLPDVRAAAINLIDELASDDVASLP